MNKTPRAAREKRAKPIFLQKGHLGGFLAVVMSGQIIYSSFEAFKGSLMIPLQQLLHVSQTQYGILMGYIGLAMFFYIVPGGWINNRFKVRTILLAGFTWRLITLLIMFLAHPSFLIMSIIAVSWAIVEGSFWPTVVNGVSILSQDEAAEGKGLAMGLLESIRRFAEFAMNGLIIIALMIWSNQTMVVMRISAIIYTVIIIPMMIWVWKMVPDTQTAKEEGKSDSVAALAGLGRVIIRPRIWLAGIAALTVYWCYVNLIYISAPYLTQAFHVGTGLSGVFGIINTGLTGVFAGLISGFLVDYLFKSSTKMLAAGLGAVFVVDVITMLIPVRQSMIWPTLIMLIAVSVAVFLAKAVILAPVAELNLPEGISGSAMSVGSFFTYAPVLWAYPLNGHILDSHAGNPATGYRIIFLITAIVAISGCVAAIALVIANRKMKMREEREAKNSAL